MISRLDLIRRKSRILYATVVTALVFISPADPLYAAAYINHHIKLTLEPGRHKLVAQDTITQTSLMARNKTQVMRLHRQLSVSATTPGVMVQAVADDQGIYRQYEIVVPPAAKSFTLEYSGEIHHALKSDLGGIRGEAETIGLIDSAGVFLAGSSYWYPVFDNDLSTFTLEIRLPADWEAVSQGTALSSTLHGDLRRVIWQSYEPQEEIFLVAGKFYRYSQQVGDIAALAFLRDEDQELAQRYLDATAHYLPLYERMIGPYPYKKFALIENFWESGYGMPSFTLLGPKVIRLPFIVNGSYPHEILHSWWGNSVYIDPSQGNWSEGLTTYLADFMFDEDYGKGSDYRLTVLQKYRNYVDREQDFALRQFRGRHNAASAAIGYGKAMMFFHMMRAELGDELFIGALRHFYRNNKFRRASYSDLLDSFAKAGHKKYDYFFKQWLEREGAPQLRLAKTEVKRAGDGYELTLTLEQIQPGDHYQLNIPIAVTLEGKDRVEKALVAMTSKSATNTWRFKKKPLRLDVDPEYDVFRRLNDSEMPAALSAGFAAKQVIMILPSSSSTAEQEMYRDTVLSWYNADTVNISIKLDNEADQLAEYPENSAVWIMGSANRYRADFISKLSSAGVATVEGGVSVEGQRYDESQNTVVMCGNPGPHAGVVIYLSIPPGLDSRPLIGKLPHYDKYSFVAFGSPDFNNTAKSRWHVAISAMTALFGRSASGQDIPAMAKLPARPALMRNIIIEN